MSTSIVDGAIGLHAAKGATQGGYALIVPIHTVSESNCREHWAKKAKRVAEHRRVMVMVLRVSPLSLMVKDIDAGLVITLTRAAPRALDDDNLRGAMKAARDGVADWLGIDDRDQRVTWEYGQMKYAPKTYAVLVQVRKR